MTRAVEQDLLIALAVLLFADELECVTQGLNRGFDRGLDVPTGELEAVDFALHVLEACLSLIQEQLRSHLRFANDAEVRSQLLLDKTQARLEDVQREIDGLKLTRRDVETTIEATIQTLRNTLEFVREQENRERDEKILFHRPRHTEAADLLEPRRVQGLSS